MGHIYVRSSAGNIPSKEFLVASSSELMSWASPQLLHPHIDSSSDVIHLASYTEETYSTVKPQSYNYCPPEYEFTPEADLRPTCQNPILYIEKKRVSYWSMYVQVDDNVKYSSTVLVRQWFHSPSNNFARQAIGTTYPMPCRHHQVLSMYLHDIRQKQNVQHEGEKKRNFPFDICNTKLIAKLALRGSATSDVTGIP